MALGVTTRTTNKDKHPGLVLLDAGKRSTQVVQEEAAAKLLEKQQKAQWLQASEAELATHERDSILTTQSQLHGPQISTNNLTIQRQYNLRPVKAGPNHVPLLDEDSGNSSDAFEPGGNEGEGSEDEDESDNAGAEDMEDEMAELDPKRASANKKTPKIKPGVRKRNAMRVKRQELMGKSTTDSQGMKRPPSPSAPSRSAKKAKVPSTPTGVKRNWNTQTPLLLQQSPPLQPPWPPSQPRNSQARDPLAAPPPLHPQSTQALNSQPPGSQGGHRYQPSQAPHDEQEISRRPATLPREARPWDPYSAQSPYNQPSQMWNQSRSQNYQASTAPQPSQYLPVDKPSQNQRPKVRNPHVQHEDDSTKTDVVRYGGLVSDSEAPEVAPSSSFLSIVSVHSPPIVHTRARHHQKAPTRKRVTFGHLPMAALTKFSKVEALVFNAIGRLDPWEIPDDGTMASCWNSVLGEEYPADPAGALGEGSLEMFVMAKKLIRRSISTRWTHGFAESANKALRDEFHERKLDTLFARAEYASKIAGPVDEVVSYDRPFLWMSRNTTNPNDWIFIRNKRGEEVERRQGLFAGCLIARTLAHHIKLTNVKIPGYSPHSQPRGALLMAGLAVHRAVLYHLTGEFKPPTPRKEREFSKQNWGDFEIKVQRNGATFRKVVKRATLFKDTVDGLTADQWATIMAEASKYTHRVADEEEEDYWESGEEEGAMDLLTDYREVVRG